MGLFNNAYDILFECGETDCAASETIDDSVEEEDVVDRVMDAEEELEDQAEEDDEVDDEIEYSEAAIPVLATSSHYIVEFEMLAKYMATRDCTVKEAIENICEANSLSFDEMAVCLESKTKTKAKVKSLKDKAKNAKTPTAKKKAILGIKNVADKLEGLKDSGVKIIRKKDKKSKKK